MPMLHALNTCTLFRMRNLGYNFGVRPRIAHVSRLLKLNLFNPSLYEMYWHASEVRDSKDIYI